MFQPAILSLAAALVATAQESSPVTETVQVLDGRVIVRALNLSQGPSELEDLARWAGLDPRSVQALPSPGWSVVEFSPVTAMDLRGAVAALAGSGDLAFAGPILRDPKLPAGAGWGAPQPRLLLCGRDGDVGLALQAVAELAPELILVSDHFGGLPGALVLSSPERDGYALLDTVAKLAADPRTAWAEPDWWITGRGTGSPPNDPLFGDQWAHENTGQSGGLVDADLDTLEAWDLSTGAASVPVLVIDVGVDLIHADLLTAGGVDLTDDGGAGGLPFNGCDSHGTWVAGCVSATKDNGLGVAGAAPSSPVLSARALVANVTPPTCPGSWTTNASWTVDALDWGFTNGARVTVNSNSYGFTSAAIDARYALAKSQGMINFASSGNFGESNVSYPSSLPGVNSVGAIDRDGTKASFSSTGPQLDFVGPGVAIQTTDRTGFVGGDFGDFIQLDGTSFSTPLVAGVAALVLAADPTLTVDQVELILAATASDLGASGRDDIFGNGLPKARAAVELALGLRDAVLAGPGTISLSGGGVQTIELLGGANSAGEFYWVLGSASGTSPGIPVDGFVLPLVPDNWLDITLGQANVGVFGNTLSTLDGQGRGTATITLPGGLNPFLAGLVLRHTFVRLSLTPTVAVAIQPPAPAPLEMVP